MNIALVILAAGNSTRWDNSNCIKKEFATLSDKESVLKKALYSSYNPIADSISNVFIVYKDGLLQETKNAIDYDSTPTQIKEKIKFIMGGKTRAESTKNALDYIKNNPQHTHIVTHDGARPFLKEELVLKLLSLINEYDAVIPTIPLVDTIKQVDKNFVLSTPNRCEFRAVQTPQFYKADVLINAYEKNYNENDYDDSQTVERNGKKIFVTDGDINNIKITYKEDLYENFNRL